MEHKYRVLRPSEFSCSVSGDYGYEIDGVKSENSYANKHSAKAAMERAVCKLLDKEFALRNMEN